MGCAQPRRGALLRELRSLSDPALSKQVMIEAKNLTYEAGGTCLLELPSFQLNSIGLTVVMGPNGAGKSLLVRMLHGLVDPTSGQLLFDGHPLTADLRRKQALVFQKPVLLRRSVSANIDFVLKSRGKPRANRDALLDRVGLLAHADRPARRLSGGEQQRLAIARALATDPEVLFLDEPTASLDPSSTQSIERIVRQVMVEGVRVVFVTHDIGQARRLADNVVFLANGRLAEQTSAAAFFETPQTAVAQAYLAGKLEELVER